MVDLNLASAPKDPVVGANIERLEFWRGKKILNIDFIFVRQSGAVTSTRVTNVSITGADYDAALVASQTPGDSLAEKAMTIEDVLMSRIDAFVSTLTYVQQRLAAAMTAIQ